MAYLGTERLKKLIANKQVIQPTPDFSRVKNGAYELSLGNEVFRTDSKDKKKEILKIDKEQVTINPGQFALLLTEETVNIPLDKIAFISIKAGIKLRGLINVSGFHVDPGFKGKLLFSVYNAGTSPISMEKGEPYFLIWFAELDLKKGEKDSYNGEHKNQNSIAPKYIDALTSGELASPNVLLEKINDNYKILDSKATTREYIIKTGIAIVIVVAIKFVIDWFMYGTGVNHGYKIKSEQIVIDSTINNLMREKIALTKEIDSLKKIKDSIK
jgi:dCTP deaminase